MAGQFTTNIPPPPRTQNVADLIEYMHQLYKAVALESRFLGAQVTVEGQATEFTVALDIEMPDTEYEVCITPIARTGEPATDSDRVDTVNKEKKRFTVRLKAAPGDGNSVTFDWLLRR